MMGRSKCCLKKCCFKESCSAQNGKAKRCGGGGGLVMDLPEMRAFFYNNKLQNETGGEQGRFKLDQPFKNVIEEQNRVETKEQRNSNSPKSSLDKT
jgi:hypothetical protein